MNNLHAGTVEKFTYMHAWLVALILQLPYHNMHVRIAYMHPGTVEKFTYIAGSFDPTAARVYIHGR